MKESAENKTGRLHKLTAILLTAALVFALGMVTMADTSITVSGTGEALVPADTAIISLGVSAVDKDVMNAQARVNTAIADIRAALIEGGVPKEDINTDYINIYAMYDYSNGTEELSSYNANSTLAIRTDQMDMVGEYIDIALQAGANTLNNISFSASDTSAAQEQALKAAVKDARQKAQVLAEASGMTVKSIESINEGSTYSFDRGVVNNFAVKEAETAAAGDMALGTTVQAAKLTVTANISVTFRADD